jgi:hypothetical protein
MSKKSKRNKAKRKSSPGGQKESDFLKFLNQIPSDTPHYKEWENFSSRIFEANYRGYSELRGKLINGETPDARSRVVEVFVEVYCAGADGAVACVTDYKSAEDCVQQLESCLNGCLELFKGALQKAVLQLTPVEYQKTLADLRWRLQQRLELAKAEALKSAREPFRYSPDYRSVSLRGQSFSLTVRQAEIIQILHNEWKSNAPDVSGHYILAKLETDSSRLIDSFRSNKEAYKALVRKGEKRGTYRLNL